MVEDGRDCREVLVQIAAVRSELSGAGRVLLKDHVSRCLADAVERNDAASIRALDRAIDDLLK